MRGVLRCALGGPVAQVTARTSAGYRAFGVSGVVSGALRIVRIALPETEGEAEALLIRGSALRSIRLGASARRFAKARTGRRYLAETVRFELTDPYESAVFKTAGLNRSPKSPD